MPEIVPVTHFTEPADENIAAPVCWDVSLPPSIDANRIGINMGRLRKLHRLGGIASSVVTSYQGPREEYTPDISGVNADGTAVAARTGTLKKAEDSRTGLQEAFDQRIRPPYNKIIASNAVNKAALADRVSDKVRAGASDPEEIWAVELDKIIRSSLRYAAKRNLVGRSPLAIRAVESWILLPTHPYLLPVINYGRVFIQVFMYWMSRMIASGINMSLETA